LTNDRNAALGPVRDALNSVMDPLLAGHDFARRRNAILYKRQVETAQQSIEFSCRRARTRNPALLAHVGGTVSITIPEVNAIVAEMSQGNPIPVAANNPTIKCSVESLGPKRAAKAWDVHSADDLTVEYRPLADYLQEYVVPFVNEYTTPRSIIEGYERKDTRLPHWYNGLLIIAAAYILERNFALARKIVEEAFGQKEGLRREYAHTLKYVTMRR